MALFRAIPIVVNLGLITVAPAPRARSIVSSIESFSTTITSLTHSRLAMQASMFAASSCAAITAVPPGDPDPRSFAHRLPRLLVRQYPGDRRRSRRRVVGRIERAADAVGDVALRDPAFAGDSRDRQRHQVEY